MRLSAKELFRFVVATIIATHASSSTSTANAAPLHSNYKSTGSRHIHNSFGSSQSTTRTSSSMRRRDLNNINSWNFRSLSSLQLTAQPPASSADVAMAASTTNTAVTVSAKSGGRFAKIDANGNVIAQRGRRFAKTDANGNVIASNNNKFVRNNKKNEERMTRNYNDDDDEEYQPSLQEMRSQLGPIGLLVANAVEVGVSTAGSYMSGGFFGYMIGGFMGVPTLFKNAPPPSVNPMANGIHHQPPNGGMKEIQRRMGDWNSKAFTQGKSWAVLSASFSGFHALTRVCRGGVEDRWNGVIGSACTGAYLSRQGGPQAMIQGASTYAGFTYILDMVFGSGGSKDTSLDKNFDFTDAPISEEERGY